MELKHDDGWRMWELCPPDLVDFPVQLARDRWDKPTIVCRKDLPPDFNIANLYWRPTGIYREAKSRMPPEVGYQLNAIAGPYGLKGLLAALGQSQQQFQETTC